MDALLVWNTWRRLLTDDRLVDWVMHPDSRAGVLDGCTEDEMAILADYAGTPLATESNIGMYRRGLVRNALGALDLVPLTRRLLRTSGMDIETVAAEFVQHTGYADNGPCFWRTAAGFVAYLADRSEFASLAQQDVLAIDAATIALARRLGEIAPSIWPDSAAAMFSAAASGMDWETMSFLANPAATVASSSCDLTPWIESPFDFDGKEELEASPRHWLIYVPAAESVHEYAELSERSARAFNVLETFKSVAEISLELGDLSRADVISVIGSLAELGVVMSKATLHSPIVRGTRLRSEAAGNPQPHSMCFHSGLPAARPMSQLGLPQIVEPDSHSGRLSNDAFVMLDPAVELLEAEVAEHRLLSHRILEVGMVVPPGDGLLGFVTALTGQPINVGILRAQFDNQQMIDKMLASLCQHGFTHVTSRTEPTAEELAQLRSIAARRRNSMLRSSIAFDLDAPVSIEHVSSRLNAETHPPELLLRCRRLADHKSILGELAGFRKAGTVRMHQTVLQTADLSADGELRRSLVRLDASVQLEGISWLAPGRSIVGLDEMIRDCVPVHAIMAPDRSILDDTRQRRVIDWARSAFLSGLCLRLDPGTLWPTGQAEEKEFVEIFEATHAIENELGDVRIVNLPSDEVLLGNMASSRPSAEPSDLTDRFRAAYLRWRLPFLKSCETDNSWSQIPEVEDKLVRAQEDLLPNHPELLLLGPGRVLVDVCGGLGRVARRLSPAVGDDGLIISVEMFRCVSDRARRFACERNFTNLQFRPGLAQRLPLPDASADAAVNEWTGGIWELGLGSSMLAEMARVVRPGGRIAVTHRLAQLHLASLARPWVQYDEIYVWLRKAFVHPQLTIIAERIWGQIVPSLVGEKATFWRKQYMPRLINPYDLTYKYDDNPDTRADVYLTIIAHRR